MVVLTAYLVFGRSPESKDGQEQMQASLERIEHRVDELARERRREENVAYGRFSAD